MIVLFVLVDYVASRWVYELATSELESLLQREIGPKVQHLCNMLLQAGKRPIEAQEWQ